MNVAAAAGPPAAHQSFAEELAGVSTALSRLKAAHLAEVAQVNLENGELRRKISHASETPSDPFETERTGLQDNFPRQYSPPSPPSPGAGYNGRFSGGRSHSLPSLASPFSDSSPAGVPGEVFHSLIPHAMTDATPSLDAKGSQSDEGARSDLATPKSATKALLRSGSMGPAAPKVQVRKVWEDVAPDLAASYSAMATFKILYEHNTLERALSRSTRSRSKFLDPQDDQTGRCYWFLIVTTLCSSATLHPSGPPRIFWNLVCLCFIMYDLVVVPLHAFDVEDAKIVQACDWMCSIWWTLDLFMTFRTGYFVGTRLEMRTRFIAWKYAKSWLACDVVIIVTEWVSRVEEVLASVTIMRSSRVLRSLRLMRLIRVPKVVYFWDGMLETVNSNVHILCFTMLFLTLVLILVIHIVTCIWYSLGSEGNDGWVSYDIHSETDGNLYWYMSASRWVIAQFNGRTDLSVKSNFRERFFTCMVGVLMAVMAHAMFISYITKSMLDLSELVSEKTRLNRLVNQYLSSNPLPPNLSTHVKRCQKEFYDIKREAHIEEQVLKVLPRQVQIDVLYEIRAPIVTTHNFFNTLHFESPSLMRILCRTVVHSVSARKNEVVFRHGDSCNRMLFTDKLTAMYSQFYNDRVVKNDTDSIFRGFMSEMSNSAFSHLGDKVLSPEDAKLSPIPRDFWICEAALWTDWQNQGSLITSTHGFLYAVHPDSFSQALKRYIEMYVMASLYANHLVQELQAQEYLTDILNFEVQLVPPIQLKVTVVSARGLANVDSFLTGKSDPFCICKAIGLLNTCSETRFRTPTIANNLNPNWNHVAEVGLTSNQTLRFEVWDDDLRPNRCTLLGTAQINSDEFIPDGFSGEVPLSGVSWAEGALKLKIEVLELPVIG